jgi:hypothetical protein
MLRLITPQTPVHLGQVILLVDENNVVAMQNRLMLADEALEGLNRDLGVALRKAVQFVSFFSNAYEKSGTGRRVLHAFILF